jgi:hypothetical protein
LSHVKNPQALSLLGNLLQNIDDRKSVLNRLFEKNLTEILLNNIKVKHVLKTFKVITIIKLIFIGKYWHQSECQNIGDLRSK